MAGERPAPRGARVRGLAPRPAVGADGGALLPQVSWPPPSRRGRSLPPGPRRGVGESRARGRGAAGWRKAAVRSPSRRRALPFEYRVRLGALRLGPAWPRALSARVRRVLLAPDYSEDEARGDLALLQLRRPVPLGARVQPVCLPEPGARPPRGAPCWVTGWGSLRPGGETEGGHGDPGGGAGDLRNLSIPLPNLGPKPPNRTRGSRRQVRLRSVFSPQAPLLALASPSSQKAPFFTQCHSQSGDLCRE